MILLGAVNFSDLLVPVLFGVGLFLLCLWLDRSE